MKSSKKLIAIHRPLQIMQYNYDSILYWDIIEDDEHCFCMPHIQCYRQIILYVCCKNFSWNFIVIFTQKFGAIIQQTYWKMLLIKYGDEIYTSLC